MPRGYGLIKTPEINANDLRDLSDAEYAEVMSQFSKSQIDELKHTWRFWARPEQISPKGNWNNWLALAGRGWGKTRAGAEWTREQVIIGRKRIAAVAPTNSDIRKVMVEGESGLLSICWAGDKTLKGVKLGFPEWAPTNRTLTWENGAKVEFFSAEDPERLRGPQFEAAWTDELCAWRRDQDTWDMLQFCLRLGQNPQTFITTTPKTTKLLRSIMSDSKTIISSGSTFDNAANLADKYLETVREKYEGTRLGRQELHAEVLDEASGALWNRSLLAELEVEPEDVPELARIVVAVDPAVTTGTDSDLTGVIVAGICEEGHGYVLADHTDQYSPAEWARKVIELYNEYEADRIVAEKNQGGDLVRHTIHTEDDNVPVRLVFASRGKFARAEPVSALYEQHKVHHVRGLSQLEDQLVQYEPLGKLGSPDRLDALVWAITDLMLGGKIKPELKMIQMGRKGLT